MRGHPKPPQPHTLDDDIDLLLRPIATFLVQLEQEQPEIFLAGFKVATRLEKLFQEEEVTMTGGVIGLAIQLAVGLARLQDSTK